MKKIYFLLLIACCLTQTSIAQTNFNDVFYSIDSLETIGQPQAALKKVEDLQIQAKKEANESLFLKCTVYKIKFLSYLQEDAIASIIENLDTEIKIAEFPVRNILQSLEAEIYSKYYNQNSYKISQRSDLVTQNTDFTFWGTTKLLEETAYLYQASLTKPKGLQDISLEEYNAILTGDQETRKYRPTLYDLLVNRALDYYLSRNAVITQPKPLFLLFNADLFKPAIAFVQVDLNDEQATHSYLTGLKLIQQATAFHLANNNNLAVADLELRRLDFIYSNATIYNKDSLYLRRLEELSQKTELKSIASEATAKLAQYYYIKNDRITAITYYEKLAKIATDSLYILNANSGIKTIKETFVSLNFESVNTPNQAILGLINYKNTSQLNFKIYKINDDEIGNLQINNYMLNSRNAIVDSLLYKLKNRAVYSTNTLKLPEFSDYQNHTYEFKLDALPAGNYYLVQEEDSAENLPLLSFLKVSNISMVSSALNTGQKPAFLLQERISGRPIEKTSFLVVGYNAATGKIENVVAPFENIDNGIYAAKSKIVEKYAYLDVKIIHGKDTLNKERVSLSTANYNGNNKLYENAFVIYTDRVIYRPGQTLYFKGIWFDKSKKETHLASGFFGNFEAQSQDGKKLAELKFKTNDFGSFEGSFIVPQQILNGRINFKINNQFVSNVFLEEYKRPSFEIALAPEKQNYSINDSITFKGKVTAYNGYAIPNAKVAYLLKRSLGYIPNVKQVNFNQELLKADTILSDSTGEFKIRFLASPIVGIPVEKQVINYNLEVSGTDENGETQSKTASTRLKKNNIIIQAEIPRKMIKGDVADLQIRLRNLNYLLINGNVEASISKVKPSKLYSKNRLFQKADSSLISLSDYHKYFPDVEPIGNPKKVTEPFTIETVKGSANTSYYNLKFDKLNALESGNYLITIKAKSLKGDTVSQSFVIYYLNKPAIALDMKNWLTARNTQVLKDEQAEFSINLPDVQVLKEVYSEGEKIKTEWIKTGKQPKAIMLGLGGYSSLNVSFLLVYKNRIYTHNEVITLKREQDKLNYKFLSFRDQLKPGQKDNISLSITKKNGEPVNMELLATMYDASLDAISPSPNWKILFENKIRLRQPYFNGSWNTYGFNSFTTSNSINKFYFSPYVIQKSYENIDLNGYSYYGGYNSGFRNYNNRTKVLNINAYQDSLIKLQYLENAKLIKNGFDYSGRIVDRQTGLGLSGAIITLKGEKINTVSNSFGYFKIKVPENGILSIEYAGHKLADITARAGTNYPTIAINKYFDEGKKISLGSPGADIPITIRGSSTPSINSNIVISTPFGSGNKLNEVVVVGYGTQKKTALMGRVAGVQTEDQNSIFTNVDGIVRPIVRTNFAETAFFLPQLKADSNGVFQLPFTLPDALTKWHFKAFAYDKDLNSVAIDTQIVAQKSLMVQSNMPRFFRAGDTVNVKLRLINLTKNELKAKLKVEFYNPLNNEPLDIVIGNTKTDFVITPNNNATAEISLAIPQQVEAIGYRFIADAGKFADGEQNSLPVLANSVLLTQSMSMLVKQGVSKTFVFDELVNNKSKTLQNKSLTFEFTSNPNWLVAEAIPYLAEPKYEGSESIFSALYANSITSVILDKNPGIKKYFANFKDSSSNNMLAHLEKNPELKSILLQESPWLKDALNEKEQRRKLALFFTMDAAGKQQTIYLEKLNQLQLPNGAFPWMGGTYEDQFISQHILAGFGQLKSFNALRTTSENDITKKLLSYVESKISQKENAYLNAHAWYAISYFENEVPLNLKTKWQEYVKNARTNWLSFNLYQQTLASLTLSRLGEKELAKTISNSIQDRAIKTKELGAYWPSTNWGCFWYQSPIETHSLIIEMLEETEPTSRLLPELKLWLLRQKQTNNWGTTKATTLACYALLKQPGVLENNSIPDIKLGGKNIFTVKPELKAEEQTGYLKTNWLKEEIRPEFGKVEVANASQTGFGALYWQYTEKIDKVKPAANGLTLIRQYYLKNRNNNTYTEISENHQAKVGDLVKVIVTLKSDRDYEYVLLKDMRPSATEPVQQISRYNYQDGLFYYHVSKDVSTNFFINYLRKGNYVFEYELRVAQSGKFSTGISTIESMYAPEYRSNSGGKLLIFGR